MVIFDPWNIQHSSLWVKLLYLIKYGLQYLIIRHFLDQVTTAEYSRETADYFLFLWKKIKKKK